MGNIGILAIGVLLIIAVLFIGYKMDTASDSTQARKAAKAVKDKKAKLKQKQSEYEYTDKEESDIYTNENLYDMHYESDDDESYESDFVSPNDLAEEDEYEEDDISLFEQQPTDNYTFNNDIDDEIAFETYDPADEAQEVEEVEEPEYEEYVEEEEAEPDGPEAIIDFGIFDNDDEEQAIEPVVNFEKTEENEEFEGFGGFETASEPEPEKPKRRGRPKKVKEEKEEAPKAKKGRKAKKEVEPEQEPETEYDFSSTMVFDVDKLNAEIDSLDDDNFSYSDAVDMDSKISELDDEEEVADTFVDGPFKPIEEDAESFMDKINKMKEVASVDDFSGFSVDTRDEDLKAVHKKYTKKKTEEDFIDDTQISFMPDEQEEPAESVDIGFLAEMEKTLKQNQKDRMAKGRKKKDE